ncbi:MAG: hypothetical protein CVU59_11080 [Deltaproteobacteria bacterium HGW-Deltaproteobacteria-17]|nr:MAG: hypothetical protein CVU59_11080 [Deltaproteobacteria bacterium HGW-Deltaproteobacteria-17]
MTSTYEYQIYLNIQKLDEETAEPGLPALPEGLHVRLTRQPDTRQTRVWEGSLSIGHSRAELQIFAKWMREELPKTFAGKISLYDPQLGRSLFMERDEEEWVESVCKHDAWILSNLGGDSLHVEEPRIEMPARTKMLIWFALLLVALYFLTNFGLTLYFR